MDKLGSPQGMNEGKQQFVCWGGRFCSTWRCNKTGRFRPLGGLGWPLNSETVLIFESSWRRARTTLLPSNNAPEDVSTNESHGGASPRSTEMTFMKTPAYTRTGAYLVWHEINVPRKNRCRSVNLGQCDGFDGHTRLNVPRKAESMTKSLV